MHGVVAPPVADHVAEDAESEAQRLADAAAAIRRVQVAPRRHADHLDALQVGLLTLAPLASRQVGDLDALLPEGLGEAAVPALGATYRVRVQAVVDDAEPHGAAGSSIEGHRDQAGPFAGCRM